MENQKLYRANSRTNSSQYLNTSLILPDKYILLPDKLISVYLLKWTNKILGKKNTMMVYLRFEKVDLCNRLCTHFS